MNKNLTYRAIKQDIGVVFNFIQTFQEDGSIFVDSIFVLPLVVRVNILGS